MVQIKKDMKSKWAQKSLKNFTLFPPGSGICHQINIEYISDIVTEKKTYYILILLEQIATQL